MKVKGGDRDFVELLMLVQEHGIDVVGMACGMAVEQNTLRLPAIINLINQLVEPVTEPLPEAHFYPSLQVAPEADCKRYEVFVCGARKYGMNGRVASITGQARSTLTRENGQPTDSNLAQPSSVILLRARTPICASVF